MPERNHPDLADAGGVGESLRSEVVCSALCRQAAREFAAAEAALHCRAFLSAEAAADADRMAMRLELTRRYDAGDLERELAGEGLLEISGGHVSHSLRRPVTPFQVSPRA